MRLENLSANHQFVIHDDSSITFFSYGKEAARISQLGNVELIKDVYDYSLTTKKNLGRFLGFSFKEVTQKIKSGEYVVVEK